MKKFSIFFSALLISITLFANGGPQCKTIAEVKALPDSVAFSFNGSAVMTYFDGSQGYGGLILQDETGAILLDNQKFGAVYGTASYAKYKPNVKVSSFSALFRRASDKLPRAIFSDEQVSAMVLAGTGSFSPLKLSVDELLNNAAKYAGMAVQVDAVIDYGRISSSDKSKVADVMGAVIYKGGAENVTALPSRGLLSGYLEPDGADGIYKFIVYGVSAQKPAAFASLKDLKAFYFSKCSYNEPVAVDEDLLVAAVGSGYAIVQAGADADVRGLWIDTEAMPSLHLKVGDVISGVKGVFSAPVYQYKIVSGSKLLLSADADVKVVSAGNAVAPNGSNKSFASLSGSYFRNYEYLLYDFSVGTVEVEAGAYYFVQGENRIKVSVIGDADVDLAAYVGKNITLRAFFSTLNGPELLVPGADAVQSGSRSFATIAEMMAAGTAADGVVYTLKGEVLVSAVSAVLKDPVYTDIRDSFMFVEDASGAMCVRSSAALREKFAAGDKIQNIGGEFTFSYGAATMIVATENVDAVVVNSHGNQVVPLNATLADLKSASKDRFANRLVRVENVYYNMDGVFNEKPCAYVYDDHGNQVISYWRFNLVDRLYPYMIGIFDTYSMQGDGENFFPVKVSGPASPVVVVTKGEKSATVEVKAQPKCSFRYAVYPKGGDVIDPAKNGTEYVGPFQVTGNNQTMCVSVVAFDGKYYGKPTVKEVVFGIQENSVEYLKAHPGEVVSYLGLKTVNVGLEGDLQIEGSDVWVTVSDASLKGDFPYITDVVGVYTEADGFVVSKVSAVRGFRSMAELSAFFQSNALTADSYIVADDMFGVAFIENAAGGDRYYLDCVSADEARVIPVAFSASTKPAVKDLIRSLKVVVKDADPASLSLVVTDWKLAEAKYDIVPVDTVVASMPVGAYSSLRNVVWDAAKALLTDKSGSCAAATQNNSVIALADGKTALDVVGFFSVDSVFFVTEAIEAGSDQPVLPSANGHYDNLNHLIRANLESKPVGALRQIWVDGNVKVTNIVKTSSAKCVFVQDRTAAMCILLDLYEEVNAGLKVGDVISGVTGKYHNSLGMEKAPYIDLTSNSNVSAVAFAVHPEVEIDIKPLVVSLSDLILDQLYFSSNNQVALKYANRLIRVEGVSQAPSTDKNRPFIVQGDDKIQYFKFRWRDENKVYFTFYPKMNITAVVDYNLVNGFPVSIQPVSQASFEEWSDVPAGGDVQLVEPDDVEAYLKANEGKVVAIRNLKVVSMELGSDLLIEDTKVWAVNTDKSVKGAFPYMTDVKGVYTADKGFVISEVLAVRGFETMMALINYCQANTPSEEGYVIANDKLGVAFVEHKASGDVFYIDFLLNGQEFVTVSSFSCEAKPEAGFYLKNAKVVMRNASLESLAFDIAGWEKDPQSFAFRADEYPVAQLVPGYYTTLVEVVWNADDKSVSDETGSCVAATQVEGLLALADGKTLLNVIGFYTYEGVFYVTKAVRAEGGEPIDPDRGHYKNIGELLKAIPDQEDVFIDEPVKVNCIVRKSASSTVFLQDATGAVYVTVNNEAIEGIVAGDVVSGVRGMFVNTGVSACALQATSSVVDYEVVFKKVEGVVIDIEPLVVSVAELVDSPEVYASRLIRVEGVELRSNPDNARAPFLIQGADSISFNTYYWGKLGVETTYPRMNITGVCDYVAVDVSAMFGCSILPLNQDAVEDADAEIETGVDDGLVSSVVVFSRGSQIFVEAAEGALIEVFSLQGQRLFAAEAVSETTVVGGVSAGVVLVRVDGEVFKLLLK